MRRRWLVAGLLLLVGGLGWTASSQERTKPPLSDARPFMQLKLAHAQDLLEAIALEDFEGMATHAQKISVLTLDEDWQVLKTPDYVRHSTDFRRSTDALAEAARQKNLDGATLAYVQMTMQCVQCHKHVRTERVK